MTTAIPVEADLILDDIGVLLTMEGPALGAVEGATLACAAGRVVYAGPQSGWAGELAPGGERVDAAGRMVSPGLVDPHAHPMFGGDRAGEFAMRVRGDSYADIQAAGGGIYSSVRATRAATDEALVQVTVARLARMRAHGATTVEAKTGYALDLEGELRMLRLYAEVARRAPVHLSPTLLAHVLPAEVQGDAAARAAYISAFANELIPRAASERLAEACDVYCDQGAYTLGEARALLEAGRRAGLGLHCHAEQFTRTGATALAAELGAWSADHLERVTDDDARALAAAGTVAVLLPGAMVTLDLPRPPARRLIELGVQIALGTDCNPGSSMTESLPLQMSLACMQLRMTVEEAWLAVTRHAARALGRDSGRLGVGAAAGVVLWDATSPEEVPYQLGRNLVARVWVGASSSTKS